jgi:hypothetical protein
MPCIKQITHPRSPTTYHKTDYENCQVEENCIHSEILLSKKNLGNVGHEDEQEWSNLEQGHMVGSTNEYPGSKTHRNCLHTSKCKLLGEHCAPWN